MRRLGPFPEGLDENTPQPLMKLHERRRCSPGMIRVAF